MSAPSTFYALLSVALVVFFSVESAVQRQPPAPVAAEVAPRAGAAAGGGSIDHGIPAAARPQPAPPPTTLGAANGPRANAAGPGAGTAKPTSGGHTGLAGGGGQQPPGGPAAPATPSTGPPSNSPPAGPPGGSGTGTSNSLPPPVSSTSPSPTPSPTPCADCIAVAANCYDGVRQAQDPQSPRCINSWTGPRPGPSSPGVTADSITIAYPQGATFYGAGNDANGINRVWTDLQTYFNGPPGHPNYMFYGRKIKLVGYTPQSPPDGAVTTPATERADAAQVSQLNAFASLGTNWDFAGYDFSDQLAVSKIISASASVPSVTESHLSGNHPYEWSYTPTLDEMSKAAGRYICTQLKTDSARYSPDFAITPRKYGYIINTFPDDTSTTDTSTLDAALSPCGVTVAAKEVSQYQGSGNPNTDALAEVLALKQLGVTTVICICHINAARQNFMTAATSQGYNPEWLFTSFLHNDMARMLPAPGEKEVGGSSGSPDPQMRSAFGLSFYPEALPIDQLPITQAIKSVDPGFDWSAVQSTQGSAFSAQVWNWFYYKALLMLASGIQLGGPNLTPATFGAGLQAANAFPSPDTSDHQGAVSFTGGHTMIQDAAVMGWNASAGSPWGDDDTGSCTYNSAQVCVANTAATTTHLGPGTWCYAAGGARFGLTSFSWVPVPINAAGIRC